MKSIKRSCTYLDCLVEYCHLKCIPLPEGKNVNWFGAECDCNKCGKRIKNHTQYYFKYEGINRHCVLSCNGEYYRV